jgi:hypothetical protein
MKPGTIDTTSIINSEIEPAVIYVLLCASQAHDLGDLEMDDGHRMSRSGSCEERAEVAPYCCVMSGFRIQSIVSWKSNAHLAKSLDETKLFMIVVK